MDNFYFHIPTEVYFGKGQIGQLGPAVKRLGTRALLVYGGGSIKKTGLYQTVQAIFGQNVIDCVELGGVEPNPRIETVRRGVSLCRQHKTDVIVAVGGGSVIDCAKVISTAVGYDGDAWDLALNPGLITGALPVITVLTMAATGSEMDHFAVISDMKTNNKAGIASQMFYPRVSILDPEYTFTVPKEQTAAGVADIMSHLLENYFSFVSGAAVQRRLAEALLKICIQYGPIAYREPENYEARANIMWASSLAIDGITSRGVNVSSSAHPMEHQLSGYYDITHGVGLAILTPHWMRYVLSEKTLRNFVEYGVNVWGIDVGRPPMEIANEAIQKTGDFWRSLGLPSTLHEVGINEEHFGVMAEKAAPLLKGAFCPLAADDVRAIFRAAL
ncbi:MAG: iron-containing alcohol dehydrogenase [Clostridia bacterium]|nr:iron-containing alcohol dehydrogenase [Clostridia bacterium]